MKIYKCNHCGNIFAVINDSKVKPVCCSDEMKELIAGDTDASVEKHVPSVKITDNIVEVVVGDVIHPMLDAHHIMWIILETTNGYQIKYLKPGDEPKALFSLTDNEKPIAAYEYCNLHGLWKKEI